MRERSSQSEVLLRRGVLKICSKFTGCQSVVSIKPLCNFIETTLQHGCSPANLLHIFRTPFYKNISGGLRLEEVEIKGTVHAMFTLFQWHSFWVPFHLRWYQKKICFSFCYVKLIVELLIDIPSLYTVLV